MKGMKGFMNLLLFVLLFYPFIMGVAHLAQERYGKMAEVEKESKILRVAYYYDDAAYDLEQVMGYNIRVRGKNSTTSEIRVGDFYKIRNYTQYVEDYESDIKDYFDYIGVGNDIDFSYLTTTYSYHNTYLTPSMSSFYRRYVDNSYNTSMLVENYSELGKAENYKVDLYLIGDYPFTIDGYDIYGADPNGVPVNITLCYPYLGETICKETNEKIGEDGKIHYYATFDVAYCHGTLNITVAIGTALAGESNLTTLSTEGVKLRANITALLNKSINRTATYIEGTSKPCHMALWIDEYLKGSNDKLILDEG